MTPLAIFSGPYALLARWVVLGVLLAAVGLFGWFKGNAHGTQKLYDYKDAQITAAAKVVIKQGAATTRVVTQYRDRVVTMTEKADTIIQEVPVYVTQADNAGCSIPVGFVREYNAAVANEVPGDPSGADRAPSGVALATLAETDATNYKACHLYRARISAWEAWAKAQGEAMK